jgi:hypothetical protein
MEVSSASRSGSFTLEEKFIKHHLENTEIKFIIWYKQGNVDEAAGGISFLFLIYSGFLRNVGKPVPEYEASCLQYLLQWRTLTSCSRPSRATVVGLTTDLVFRPFMSSAAKMLFRATDKLNFILKLHSLNCEYILMVTNVRKWGKGKEWIGYHRAISCLHNETFWRVIGFCR